MLYAISLVWRDRYFCHLFFHSVGPAMQIYEAAHLALRELGQPTHLRELVKYIEGNGYFSFGAKAPERALGVAIDRRSKGIAISRPVTPALFYRSAPATYGLLEWLSPETQKDLELDEQIDVAAEEECNLDTHLLLEQELHAWLFKNLQHNALTALGFGPLRLFDEEKQSRVFGKYSTGQAGEIDMLLQTRDGHFVVLELKRSSSDVTVGQICRYVGWVMEHLAHPSGKQVHGLILAREVNEPLRLAVKATNQRIRYCTLELEAVLGQPTR
jgi:hypothetical protein